VSFGPPPDWWYNPSFKWIQQHPVAHILGGSTFFLLALFDLWAWQHLPFQWFCALLASEAQGTWEAIQVEVTPGYTWLQSGLWDWGIATLAVLVMGLAATLARSVLGI
jgi:hypothetical protein